MKVEIMLYAYLGICVAMIIFNIACIFVFKASDRSLVRKSRKFEKVIRIEVLRAKNGLEIGDDHIKFLERKLKRTGNFLAFDEALTEMRETEEGISEYLEKCYPAFLHLAFIYKKKTPIKAAYFPYILSKYRILSIKKFDMIMAVMMEYLSFPNFYCRENALNAIFSSDSISDIVKALHTVDGLKVYHNSKLLTEDILRHTRQKDFLCQRLLEDFETFSTEFKLIILNLCRYSGDYYSDYLLPLLENEETDDELRFACIRYFGSHPNKKAKAVLLKLNNPEYAPRWEYLAVTSTALGNYPSEETVASLKNNLHSSIWYVRLNSAQSLEKLGLEYKDLIEIFDGDDRYAREVMQYRLDTREMTLGEVGV